jgi:ADP-ribosylglycohydrolase
MFFADPICPTSIYRYPVWEDHHRLMGDRNDFTDDTDQLLVILQSLEQTRNGILDPINVANRLLEWRDYGIPELGTEPGRGLGYTVGRVMSHPDFPVNPHRAAFEVTNGTLLFFFFFGPFST